jgi:hypothetical protein
MTLGDSQGCSFIFEQQCGCGLMVLFFFFLLSLCSPAASDRFPHMMATFTLGSYTCTHHHSNANRNSLVKAALRLCRHQMNDSIVFLNMKPVLLVPHPLAVVTFIPLSNNRIRMWLSYVKPQSF